MSPALKLLIDGVRIVMQVLAMATTVAPTSLASGPKPTCEPFATINPQHDGIYWRFAPMEIRTDANRRT